MRPPRKALILAAGFGTRLLPLTKVVPKPLLPVGGIAMIDRALALAKSWGVRDVVINLHHGADKILRHLIDRNHDGLGINLSFEPEILGTGGALVKAGWFFKDHEPFWIINADVAADVDGRKIVRAFRRDKTIAAAWLKGNAGPRTVECRNGYISTFSSKNPGAPETYTFCGVHLVDPRVLDYLPREGFAHIITAYERAMKAGWRVAGVPVDDAFWADIGTPAQYLDANQKVRQDIATNRNSVRIVNGVILAPGVPAKKYSGIMALCAEDALTHAEYKLVRSWSSSHNMIACPLAPRGSARSFTRIVAGKKSAMLVTYDPARAENALYAEHARFLGKLGIPVPRVLADRQNDHLELFEDAGDISVQDIAPSKSSDWLEKLYARVVERLVMFHEKGFLAARHENIQLMRPFDDHLYKWEHDLFADLFLTQHKRLDTASVKKIRQELSLVSDRLLGARAVLVHRDLQSSNILLQRGRWSLIDFQGMRYGPAVYDLASLLLDPYIRIKDNTRQRLILRYEQSADPESRVQELFWLGGIQRLAQALGAYARLGSNRETRRFLAYIPPALENLNLAVARSGIQMPGLTKFLLSALGGK